jgi:hypothetical protein
VGSEMCIRDSFPTIISISAQKRQRQKSSNRKVAKEGFILFA